MSFAKQAEQRIYSWSPSRLSAYNSCPRAAKYKYIDKLPEPGSPAMERGSAIHEKAEMYVTGRAKSAGPDLKNPTVKKLLNTLRTGYKKKQVRVELELAFNSSWKLVQWMAKDVYCRFKVDVLHMLGGGKSKVIDWKTGRFKDEGAAYDPQLSGYAVAALSSGLVQQATAQLVFTDVGQVVEREAGTLELKDLAKAQRAWDQKAKPMLTDRKFPPKPGNACRWCAFSTNKGGPCEY